MNDRQYRLAFRIGHDAAREVIGNMDPDIVHDDDVDDAAFPGAFSDALDALPELEADVISDPVHAGIADAVADARSY